MVRKDECLIWDTWKFSV